MKRLVALFLAMLMLPFCALAEEGCIVNLVNDPEATYAFEEGKELFTIVYPNIHGSDAAILLYQDDVWMIDCSTDDQAQDLVVPTLEDLGITHIDVAFNSHPHEDHISGFEFIGHQATIGKLLLAFPKDYNQIQKTTVYRLSNKGTAIEYVADGDVLTMGDGGVEMTVIRRTGGGFTPNDLSASLMIRYGQRTLFTTGDIENRGQRGLLKALPECGVKCDILKYPHHGHATINMELYKLMDPELVLITAHESAAKMGFDFCRWMDVPAMSTWYGILRFRTDGTIWVVDMLPTRVQNGRNRK